MSAVDSCCSVLEPGDLQQVQRYGSWHNLQGQLTRHRGDGATRLDFATLTPRLIKMKTFTDEWIQGVHTNVHKSALWNFNRLVSHQSSLVPSFHTSDVGNSLTKNPPSFFKSNKPLFLVSFLCCGRRTTSLGCLATTLRNQNPSRRN